MIEDTKKNIENREIGIDIYLVKHCNLRCRACSRYSNISKPAYYDIDDLKNDLLKIKECSEKENVKISRFTFTGGEPLLYPKTWLIDIIEYTRKLFPYIGLSIFTNCKALLEKDNFNLFDIFKANNCSITYTNYVKANINYNLIREITKAKGIYLINLSELDNNTSTQENKDSMYLIRLSKNIKGNLEDKKKLCECDCPSLWQSKIYPCGTCAFIDTLNCAYKTKFERCSEDYIDIKDFTCEKYFNFISKSVPFCKYCMNVPTIKIPWSQNKSTIGDYVSE